jgi:biopolymer transport protein ExbB
MNGIMETLSASWWVGIVNGWLLDSIQHYWRAGGWLMLPLGVVCFLILNRYFLVCLRLKEALSTPAQSLVGLEKQLTENEGNPTFERSLETVPGAKARIARHLLAFGGQRGSLSEVFSQCRGAELSAHAHSFHILRALVMSAPLLGLLGTVLGMIATFEGVAASSSETANLVAGGISQALITTQVGLVAALPGTFGLAHLSRLFERLKNELDAFHAQIRLAVNHHSNGEQERTKS